MTALPAYASDKNFASAMRRVRVAMGYTVRSLSERLAESGVVISPSGITKIELGQRRVSVGEAMAIARCLEVNLGVMMSGDPIRVVVTA